MRFSITRKQNEIKYAVHVRIEIMLSNSRSDVFNVMRMRLCLTLSFYLDGFRFISRNSKKIIIYRFLFSLNQSMCSMQYCQENNENCNANTWMLQLKTILLIHCYQLLMSPNHHFKFLIAFIENFCTRTKKSI